MANLKIKSLGNNVFKVELVTRTPLSSRCERALDERVKRHATQPCRPAQPQRQNPCFRPTTPCRPCQQQEKTFVCRNGNKVHGIDIHVDVPNRKDFVFGHEWRQAMKDFENLEKLAKKCDWPCQEPPKWAPTATQPAAPKQTPWWEDECDDDDWDDDDWDDDDFEDFFEDDCECGSNFYRHCW